MREKQKQMKEQGHHPLGGALRAPGACYENHSKKGKQQAHRPLKGALNTWCML
jgi:hypothetical protein